MNNDVELLLERNSIENQITNTLLEIGKLYELGPTGGLKTVGGTQNSFSDGWDKQGIINTAEALECFFIPYFRIPGVRESFWRGELIDLGHVEQSLRFLVKDFKSDPDNDGRLGLSGSPYMNFKLVGSTSITSGISTNLDFLDTACFLLTCLLDAKAISRERDRLIREGKITKSTPEILPLDLIPMVDERIAVCVRMLHECDDGPGAGWTYTNDATESERPDFLYFTWNALESLEVLINYLDLAPTLVPEQATSFWGGPQALSKIKALLREKESYLSAKFLSKDNKKLYLCQHQVDFGEGDTNWYYNLFALIGLLITDARDMQSITAAFVWLMDNFSRGYTIEKAKKAEHGKFLLVGSLYKLHKKEWSERALIPLVIKALARFKSKSDEAFSAMVSSVKAFEKENEFFSHYLRELVLQKLSDAKNGFYNVWDRLDEPKYSIYYTERAVEALVTLYSVLFPQGTVTQYYRDITDLQQAKEQGTTGYLPPIHIEISGDLINESIVEAAKREAENKIRELIASDEIKTIIRGVLEATRDEAFELQMTDYLEFLRNNIGVDKPDKKYKRSLDTLTEIVGLQLLHALYVLLEDVSQSEMKGISKEDFAARLRKGVEYLAKWEAQGPIDFSTTIYELKLKNIIQLAKHEDTGKTSDGSRKESKND